MSSRDVPAKKISSTPLRLMIAASSCVMVPPPPQKSDHFREELDVPAVITGNANGAHVFLDRGANNIADRAMITKIDDLNAVPDELEMDCIDRAVVAVTNWNSGEDANR